MDIRDHSSYSYCTLFNVNYLDKGIVTVNSLINSGCKGNIYILAMDEESEKILKDYYDENSDITVVSLEALLDDELKNVKSSRSKAEFCWTCTASLIRYVLCTYNEMITTYIDADMYFYSNPDAVVQEMIDDKKEVQIIEHRFKDDYWGRESMKAAGRYCVEFNTFMNTSKSMELLETWRNDTIKFCFSTSSSNVNLGDQYYLNEWTDKYDFIHVVNNVGAGIAPWNINRYKVLEKDISKIITVSFDGVGEHKAVFYHFHNLAYLNRDTVDIKVYYQYFRVDTPSVKKIYYPYLREIDITKNMLEKRYGIYPLVQKHPGINSTRTGKYYLRRLFSKDIVKNVITKIKNDITARNKKRDIVSIKDVYEV